MTTDTTLDPHFVHPPHDVQDSAKRDRLVAAMEADGWQGRAILAWRCGEDGEVCALTGSHRIAAARAAGLDEVPALVIEVETEALASALESLRDFEDLRALLTEHGVDEDAIALAQAEIDAAE